MKSISSRAAIADVEGQGRISVSARIGEAKAGQHRRRIVPARSRTRAPFRPDGSREGPLPQPRQIVHLALANLRVRRIANTKSKASSPQGGAASVRSHPLGDHLGARFERQRAQVAAQSRERRSRMLDEGRARGASRERLDAERARAGVRDRARSRCRAAREWRKALRARGPKWGASRCRKARTGVRPPSCPAITRTRDGRARAQAQNA